MEKQSTEHTLTLKDTLLNDSTGFIPIPRQLSLVLGLNATTLLVELYDRYDYYSSKELLNTYGEFFYTISDVETNIGLSRKEQNTAINILKDYNFIKRIISRSIPAKRYFLMNTNITKLLKDIYKEAEEKKTKIIERNKSEIERILGL